MKVSLYDWDKSGEVVYRVDDVKVHEFIQWLLTSDGWKKGDPDGLIRRAVALRKYLMENKMPVGAPKKSETSPATPPPIMERLSSAGVRALGQEG